MSRKKSNSTRKFKELIKQNEQKVSLEKNDNAFFKELSHLSNTLHSPKYKQEYKNKETSIYDQRANIKCVELEEVMNILNFKNTTEENELFLLHLLNALSVRNNYFKRVTMELELIKQLPTFYISERDYNNILAVNDQLKPENLVPYFIYQLNCNKPLLIEPTKIKFSEVEAERAIRLIKGYYTISSKQLIKLHDKAFYKFEARESLLHNIQTKINCMQEDFRNKQV